jgi:hypothetical protein
MLITDLQYFGTISHIQSLLKEDHVYFDNQHPFSKMSFKNRMVIATAQGPLHLTIPIIGGRDQKSPLQDIQIAYDSPWQKQHYKALVSNYQRSPYFEYYQDELKSIYDAKPIMLIDFLISAHIWTKKQIKGKWEMAKETTQQDRLFDPYLPKNYQTYPNALKYQQVFEDRIGFLPNLSILDLLFNCGGKQANQLLLSV